MPDIVGTAYVTILPNTAGFSGALSAQMAGATAAAGGLGAASLGAGARLTAMSNSLMGVSTKAGLVARSMRGTTIAVGLLAAAGLKTAYDFDTSMKRVKAVTGETSETMKQFSALAQQLGRDTAFTATQAAEGMTTLALSGFKAKEIIRSLPGVLDLAAAGGIQLAEAAKIATSTLRGFGMQANDIGRVNDVLSSVFTTSTTTVQDLGNAFKYVGPVARAVGIQFEETGAALGILANAGLRGTQGGTALRNILAKIVNPTGRQAKLLKQMGIELENATGGYKTLADVVDEFNRKGATTQEVLQVFGLRGGPAFLALMQQGKTKIDLFTRAIERSGNEIKAVSAVMRLSRAEQKALDAAWSVTRQNVLTLGFNLDDTTGVLGKWIDRGDSAATAANKLNQAMLATKKQGFEQIIGATRNLDGALVDNKGNTLTFLEILMRIKKGGPEAQKALAALGEDTKALGEAAKMPTSELKALYDASLKAGKGATIARIQLEGIKGSLKRLRSSAEQLGITIFGGEKGVLATVGRWADAFAVLINNIDKKYPDLVRFAGWFVLLVGAIGPAAKLVQFFTASLGTLLRLLKVIAVDNPIIGTLIVLGATLYGAYQNSEKFRKAIKGLLDTFSKLWKKTFGQAAKDTDKHNKKAKESVSIFERLGGVFKWVGDQLAGLVNAMTRLLVPAFRIAGTVVKEVRKGLKAFGDGFSDANKQVEKSGFAGAMERIGETVQAAFRGIKRAYDLFFAPVVKALGGFFTEARQIIDKGFGDLFKGVKPEFNWDFFKDAGTRIWGALKKVVPALGDAFGRVFDQVADSFSLAESVWPRVWDKVIQKFKDTPVLGPLVKAIDDYVRMALGEGAGLSTIVAGIFQWDPAKIQQGWDKLSKSLIDGAKRIIPNLGNAIGDAFTLAAEGIQIAKDFGDKLWKKIVDKVKNVSVVGPLAEALASAFDSDMLYLKGASQIVAGIFHWNWSEVQNGLNTLWAGVVNAVTVTLPAYLGAFADVFTDFISKGLRMAADKVKNIPVVGTLLKGLMDGLAGLSDTLGGTFDFLGALLKWDPAAMGDAAKRIGLGLLDTLKGIGGMLTGIDPIMDWLEGVLMGLGAKVKDIPFVGPLVNAVIGGLRGAGDLIGAAGDLLGGIFTWDMDTIKKGLGGIGEAASSFVFDMLGNAFAAVGQGANKLGELLGMALSNAGKWIGDNLPKLMAWVGDLPGKLADWLEGLFKGGKGGGGKGGGKGKKGRGGNGITDFLMNLLRDGIGGLLAGIGELGGGLLRVLYEIVSGAIRGAPGLIANFVKGIGKLIWVGLKLEFKVLGSLLGPALTGAFRTGWNLLTKTLPSMIVGVYNFFTSIPGKVVGWLIDLNRAIAEAFRAAWNWVTTQLPVYILAAASWFRSIGTQIMGWLANVGVSIGNAFRTAWTWLTTQLPIYALGVFSWFQSLPGRIGAVLGNLGSTLGNWIGSAFNTAKLFLSNGINTVVSTASTLGSRIVSAVTGGITSAGGFVGDAAGRIWGAVKGFINSYVLGPIKNFKIPGDIPFISGRQPFGGIPLIAANGAIVTKPTQALIGEAGAEVRVPLSNTGALAAAYNKRTPPVPKVTSPTVVELGRPAPEVVLPLTRKKRMSELAGQALGMTLRGRSALKDMGVKMLAMGDVVSGPIHAIIGEAGPEVVIPLSRPKRAAELVRKSGLMDVLASTREGSEAAGVPMWANGGMAGGYPRPKPKPKKKSKGQMRGPSGGFPTDMSVWDWITGPFRGPKKMVMPSGYPSFKYRPTITDPKTGDKYVWMAKRVRGGEWTGKYVRVPAPPKFANGALVSGGFGDPTIWDWADPKRRKSPPIGRAKQKRKKSKWPTGPVRAPRGIAPSPSDWLKEMGRMFGGANIFAADGLMAMAKGGVVGKPKPKPKPNVLQRISRMRPSGPYKWAEKRLRGWTGNIAPGWSGFGSRESLIPGLLPQGGKDAPLYEKMIRAYGELGWTALNTGGFGAAGGSLGPAAGVGKLLFIKPYDALVKWFQNRNKKRPKVPRYAANGLIAGMSPRMMAAGGVVAPGAIKNPNPPRFDPNSPLAKEILAYNWRLIDSAEKDRNTLLRQYNKARWELIAKGQKDKAWQVGITELKTIARYDNYIREKNNAYRWFAKTGQFVPGLSWKRAFPGAPVDRNRQPDFIPTDLNPKVKFKKRPPRFADGAIVAMAKGGVVGRKGRKGRKAKGIEFNPDAPLDPSQVQDLRGKKFSRWKQAGEFAKNAWPGNWWKWTKNEKYRAPGGPPKRQLKPLPGNRLGKSFGQKPMAPNPAAPRPGQNINGDYFTTKAAWARLQKIKYLQDYTRAQNAKLQNWKLGIARKSGGAAPPWVDKQIAATNVGMLKQIAAVQARLVANAPIHWDYRDENGGALLFPRPVADQLLANGGVFDRATSAIVGEAGREVVIPLTRPGRALQLANESGLMDVLSQASRAQRASGSPAAAATMVAGADTVGPFRGGPGNTYNIYGVTMDQIIAEIEARDAASLRVRR